MLDPRDLSWDHLKDVLMLHRAGSLSSAAARSGLAISTLSRRLDALERRLGAKVFDRRHDGLHPTSAGLQVLSRAEDVERAVAGLARDLAERSDRPLEGVVRISSSPVLSERWVAPAVAPLIREHPGLNVVVVGEPVVVSVARGDADLAVRLGRPRDVDLIGQRLASVRSVLAWSPDYEAACGPVQPDALETHTLVGYLPSWDAAPEMRWLLARAGARGVRLRCATTPSLLAALRAGAGVGLLSEDLSVGLHTCEVPDAPPPREVWLLRHRDRMGSAALDAVSHAITRAAEVTSPR